MAGERLATCLCGEVCGARRWQRRGGRANLALLTRARGQNDARKRAGQTERAAPQRRPRRASYNIVGQNGVAMNDRANHIALSRWETREGLILYKLTSLYIS